MPLTTEEEKWVKDRFKEDQDKKVKKDDFDLMLSDVLAIEEAEGLNPGEIADLRTKRKKLYFDKYKDN